jgi:hypothetical protein
MDWRKLPYRWRGMCIKLNCVLFVVKNMSACEQNILIEKEGEWVGESIEKRLVCGCML